MTTAPTLAEIETAGLDLLIHCETCRVLRLYPAPVPGNRSAPIDTLKFRCSKCGALGEPHVYGPGNAMIGRPQIWPPKGP